MSGREHAGTSATGTRARAGGRGAARARRPLPLLAVLAAALPLAGCIEFLEPNLPPASPAILQLSVHMLGQQATVEATLQPGMSLAHEWRTVPNDSLLIGGQRVVPRTVRSNGGRDYSATVALTSEAGPVTIETPVVAGIASRPVDVRWYGLRRLDPDTVVLTAGADLRLHVDPSKPAETPPPTNPQWFLSLTTGGHLFQLGADGLPPAELRVPVEFLPGDSTNTVITATLLVLHGGVSASGAGEYLLNGNFDQRLVWTVVRPKGTIP